MRQYGDGNGNRIVECVQIGEVITQSRQAWTSYCCSVIVQLSELQNVIFYKDNFCPTEFTQISAISETFCNSAKNIHVIVCLMIKMYKINVNSYFRTKAWNRYNLYRIYRIHLKKSWFRGILPPLYYISIPRTLVNIIIILFDLFQF